MGKKFIQMSFTGAEAKAWWCASSHPWEHVACGHEEEGRCWEVTGGLHWNRYQWGVFKCYGHPLAFVDAVHVGMLKGIGCKLTFCHASRAIIYNRPIGALAWWIFSWPPKNANFRVKLLTQRQACCWLFIYLVVMLFLITITADVIA